ncbi:uncharacterized protein EV422DRAFT_508544 [Fimicolochytrium jonesii]|uniref:uncharacterized protein n=1 Tax=Fimicolochytrium jonesii TaxID=1396493 RepID=UPI0022FEF9DF|nr:uncharacterized protein EV422DRAFT_508544 [Fimicolochytrium jonesii]KAI8818000.1 hypothetical protein EV422DRAFT_508544 [Fimicolochytrium jonesii]
MSNSGTIKNVLIIGAGGNLGPSILTALLSEPKFVVTVLSRESSTSTFPSAAQVIKIPSYDDKAALIKAFTGQDAVINVVAGSVSRAAQNRIADAAAEAGVKRYIPNEFGSETRNPAAWALLPIFEDKYLQTKHAADLAEKHPGFTWTSVITGGFFDWGLKVGFYRFDLKQHTASIIDSGNAQATVTTLARIGDSIVSILLHPAETANRYIYTQSFNYTQNELLAALEKHTNAKWTVTHANSDELIKSGKAALAKGDFSGFQDIILAYNHGDEAHANHEKGVAESRAILGLPKQDLDTVLKEVLKA